MKFAPHQIDPYRHEIYFYLHRIGEQQIDLYRWEIVKSFYCWNMHSCQVQFIYFEWSCRRFYVLHLNCWSHIRSLGLQQAQFIVDHYRSQNTTGIFLQSIRRIYTYSTMASKERKFSTATSIIMFYLRSFRLLIIFFEPQL